jgi:hypothetical protein
LVPSKPIKAPAVQIWLICSSTAGTKATSYPTAASRSSTPAPGSNPDLLEEAEILS